MTETANRFLHIYNKATFTCTHFLRKSVRKGEFSFSYVT